MSNQSSRSICQVLIGLVQLMSRHYDLQKIFFGEIVFDNDFHKSKALHGDIDDDDNFKNAKTYKICNDIHDILYIGITCNTLKSCLSKYNKESKLKRNTCIRIYVCNIYVYIYTQTNTHTYTHTHTHTHLCSIGKAKK